MAEPSAAVAPGEASQAGDGHRRPWSGRHVVLGVAGGIAAYKSVQVARDLTRLGATVDVVLTRAAREFLGAITFEAVTGRPVLVELIEPGRALDHIRIARAADVVCVAPATADLMARAAAGRANDLLAAVLLATRAPVLMCPAMNDAMWTHAQTQANAAHLATNLGYGIVGPETGALAYGEGTGPGRMVEPAVIIEHIGRALEPAGPFSGRRVLVTAGATREPVDPVRVLSNRSSGRMGFAIASAAWRRGADVVVIAGATTVEPPPGPRLVRVETASDMLNAVRSELPSADVLIMSAAVADFKPTAPATTKLKRTDGPPAISLEPAPDVLAETRVNRPAGMVTVGFAIESGDGRDAARGKLVAKGLDMIVLNRVDEDGAGFEVETNRVVLIDRSDREEHVPRMHKNDIAEVILDRVGTVIGSRE